MKGKSLRRRIVTVVKKLLENEREKCDYYILIWGSGEYSDFDYKKRILLRKNIETKHKGRTIFPEDEEFAEQLEKEGITVVDAILAKKACTIIALITDDSDGVKQEICRYEDLIKGKSFLLVSDKYKEVKTYLSESVFLQNPVHWYNSFTYKKCKFIDSDSGEDLLERCLKLINIQVRKIADSEEFLLKNRP